MRRACCLALLAGAALCGCTGGGDDPAPANQPPATNPPPQTVTTTYCHGDFNRILVHDTNGVETYEVVLRPLDSTPITASGTRNGNTLLLQASTGNANLDYDMTISQDGQSIAGTVDIDLGFATFVWNEFGALGACPSFDYPAMPLPQVVSADFTDVVNDIQDISVFRSAAGHDYSDDFESCRSMKHYFSPPTPKRVNATVPVYAPFDGTVVHLETEEPNFVDDGVTNQKVVIRSSADPAVLAVLFHVDLLSSNLTAGAAVTSGEHLGHGRFARDNGTAHDFDIAAHVNTAAGVRYVSYFDLMQDAVFANYGAFGAARSDFVISEQARDADALTCNGETFTSSGSTDSWVFNLP